jgi:Phage integrase family
MKHLSRKNFIQKSEVEELLLTRISQKLPKPTLERPYAQIDFIFQQVANVKHNKATQNNYKSANTFYKKFLEVTHNYDPRLVQDPRFFINRYWDELSLTKVKTYIEQNNVRSTEEYLTSHTLVGYFSAIKNVMLEAVNNKLTASNDIFIVPFPKAIRETEQNTAYSQSELDRIDEAVNEEVRHSLRIISKKGYEKTGVGNDPRLNKHSIKSPEDGWGNQENLRWYFENVLDCNPIVGDIENKKKHINFVDYAPRVYFKDIGGLSGIYRKWGVTPYIDSNIIMPLLAKLAIETGLNPQSLYELNIDCYGEKHPLSGVPYLRYFKARSGGEKEFHVSVDTDEKNLEIKQFRYNQARVIEKTINRVIEVTKDIRENAPEKLRQKLFLYQSTSQRQLGKIGVINTNVATSWCKRIVEKYNLKSDSGERLTFSIVRFRSTRATRLVEKGIDVFELQHEMGHNSILTTLNYLEKNHLNLTSKKETDKALNNIFSNLSWAEEHRPSYSNKEINEGNESIIYKGMACDCKNPFSPPSEVTKLQDYQPGQACSRFNMCFFCDNVLVFKSHLPLAWVYKRQIEVALSNSNDNLPNQLFYNRTLDIIESLFDSSISEFDEKDLEWAKGVAEGMDEMIDPVTYKPIVEGEIYDV